MIHPHALVEEGAQLGAACEIMAGAVVTRHCRLGDRVVVHPYAVVGGDPQYLKVDRATPPAVEIGSGTVIREHVTINRSIHVGQTTVVGARCFLMANAHVGHDCLVADEVVLANNVMLAGHVAVGAGTFVGGGAGIHQYCRIGEGVMVAGLARVTLDVPPFTLVAERDEIVGFNLVGMRRRGFARETIRELKEAFRAVYSTPGNIRTVAAGLLASAVSAEARRFLEFFTQGKRGAARPARSAPAEVDPS